jgi:hypothetical protein
MTRKTLLLFQLFIAQFLMGIISVFVMDGGATFIIYLILSLVVMVLFWAMIKVKNGLISNRIKYYFVFSPVVIFLASGALSSMFDGHL